MTKDRSNNDPDAAAPFPICMGDIFACNVALSRERTWSKPPPLPLVSRPSAADDTVPVFKLDNEDAASLSANLSDFEASIVGEDGSSTNVEMAALAEESFVNVVDTAAAAAAATAAAAEDGVDGGIRLYARNTRRIEAVSVKFWEMAIDSTKFVMNSDDN